MEKLLEMLGGSERLVSEWFADHLNGWIGNGRFRFHESAGLRAPCRPAAKLTEKAARKQLQSYLESVNPNQMTPTASLLLPAPPFVSISDVRRLQFLPRGRRRALLCWSGAEWGSVRTQMLSSFIGKSDL